MEYLFDRWLLFREALLEFRVARIDQQGATRLDITQRDRAHLGNLALATVADLGEVLVLADVAQKDAATLEAGAPVGNITSAYSGIRWGTGLPRQFQYEQTQSRIGQKLTDAPQRYIENSPVFQAHKVKTPLLILHGESDLLPGLVIDRYGATLVAQFGTAGMERLKEAVLGARIEVPTPDGPARMKIPPGTQSGQRFRLRERGAMRRRNLV